MPDMETPKGWQLSNAELLWAVVDMEEQCPFVPEDQHHVLVVLLRMMHERDMSL